jgi:hypothetical protein
VDASGGIFRLYGQVMNLGILEISLIVLLAILVVMSIIWLVALIEILRSDFRKKSKGIWLLTVIFIPFFGAIIYFIIGRSRRIMSDMKAQ